LRAHSGSVLCLQFDADPDEDLIVSGSSDATIVLWKFSTGQIIQRFRKAHRESVLNVRFDKRVLVTCSKDKLIKIFNRRPLNPGDVGYPGLPGGVHPVPTTIENYGFNPTPNAGLPVIPAYTLIGTLVGHSAAVNAVQIHGNEIVSASGDRHIKVWNWVENICTRTLSGHKKGIACVQYDGRRIVSGSSDNEVRIYDKESGVVVATLRAHSNLVRTVQAGFADLPNGAEEDAELARLTDLRYFDAVDSGVVSQDISLRGRLPNAGSTRPEDITAYGAKIPPGGGGGRFGRIVSGSYDETVIIWRKDKEGVWKAQHTLRQEDAAQSALRHVKKSSTSQDTPQPGTTSPPAQSSQGNGSTSSVPNSDAWIRPLINQLVAEGVNSFRHGLRRHPNLLQRVELSEKLATLPPTDRPLFQAAIVHAMQEQQHASASTNATGSHQTPLQQNHIATTIITHSTTNSSSAVAGPSQSTIDRGTNPTIVNTHPMLGQQTATTTASPAAAPTLPPAPGTTTPGGANMARVFKLQFDARRIICCSQTTTIVGWDFANGDEKLIEASRFFAPIE
jgi:F-box and WD-40 domain protein 1/11